MKQIVKDILNSRVYEVAIESPMDRADNLSQLTDNVVYLKREDQQPVFSFKIRGAYNKIVNLSAAEKALGIICASAGNHAQGVAYSAKRLNIAATIVMPRTTPAIKVSAVKRFGVRIILEGDSYSEAAEHCQEIMAKTGQIFVHPFDDPLVIAGQGSIGHEIIRQCREVDIIFVPIGGGGLAAGIAAIVKQLQSQIVIIGVEPEDSNAMTISQEKGKRVELPRPGIFADGVAVKMVGENTFELCRKYIDSYVNVSTDEISSAIKNIYEDTRSIVEPAGALAVAGMKKYIAKHKITKKKIVAINSGANMNFDRLQFVAERTHTGEQTEALFAVTIPEKPGSLRIFCDHLTEKVNITEFNYRLMVNSRQAHIFVGLNVKDRAQKEAILERLQTSGYSCLDLTNNELAKTHIRHMVGGRGSTITERIFRFQFPERPAALSDFLKAMPQQWNISLFHYRMHGGDFGRVLIGLQIKKEDESDFNFFLANIGYQFREESDNPAYSLFL